MKTMILAALMSVSMPVFAQTSLETRVSQRLMSAFKVTEKGDESLAANARNLDLETWKTRAKQITPGVGAEVETARAATMGYFVRAWNGYLRIPKERKDGQANDFWAKLFLSEQTRQEILNRPMQFKIVHLARRGPMVDAVVQFWPDLTGSDSSARVVFRLRETSAGLKIYEMNAGFFQVVRNMQASLDAYRGRPQALVQRLLETKLTTRALIEEYR